MKTEIKKLEKSEVEIQGVLEAAELEKFEKKALARITDRLELPGFRKGKAPENVVRENVNEMMILEEMAELAISDAYPKIIEDNHLDAIGRPMITITKIAKGSDLEFKIVTAVLPELDLPDYKAIAHDIRDKNPINNTEVDEASVDKAILDLRKMRAEQGKPRHEHEDSDAANHTHEEIPESEYPSLDDEFAKSFGDFADVESFKNKIRENLKTEKETEAKDKLRLAIVEGLLKDTKGDIPEILIESETDKILYKLEADISNMGFKFEDYLTQIGKKIEDLRAEWRPDAEKRAKLAMVVHTISEKEKLAPNEEEVEKEVTNILSMYKDADPARARAYIENMLENEKVFQFLETQ